MSECQPAGHERRHFWRASRAAARVMLLVSIGVLPCSSAVASLARRSARSLPTRPLCAGTHWRYVHWPHSARASNGMSGSQRPRQPGQVAVGRGPTQWRYWVDALQWPARSWWMSTAASRLFSRTGPGRVCSRKMERYQPPSQLSCQERRMVLVAARVMLRTSRGTLVWSSSAAYFASTSARSLPGSPQWAGTHWRWSRRPRPASCNRSCQLSSPSRLACAAGPASTV